MFSLHSQSQKSWDLNGTIAPRAAFAVARVAEENCATTCSEQWFKDIKDIFEECQEYAYDRNPNPNPRDIIKCTYAETFKYAKECFFPCPICRIICGLNSKLYPYCYSEKEWSWLLSYLHCLQLACIVYHWIKIYYPAQIKIGTLLHISISRSVRFR